MSSQILKQIILRECKVVICIITVVSSNIVNFTSRWVLVRIFSSILINLIEWIEFFTHSIGVACGVNLTILVNSELIISSLCVETNSTTVKTTSKSSSDGDWLVWELSKL